MINVKKIKPLLIFIPLGGCEEIGMNINLYHINGKWIIIDLGIGFTKNNIPGIEIIIPNIDFIIKKIKKNILGIIITHAHDDHIGSIQYLWKKIKCPIYSTKFTYSVIKTKWKVNKIANKIKFFEVKSNYFFTIGDFKITFIPISHSIPENNGLLIETNIGNIFHTGDWKIDYEPIVGNIYNKKLMSYISKKKILALISDSTNVFKKDHSISEGILKIRMEKIFKMNQKFLIITTTFASNVARLLILITCAIKFKKKIILIGNSIKKMYHIAVKYKYLPKIDIYSERIFHKYRRDSFLIICTGCQGEKKSALITIIENKNKYIKLKRTDVIIFSSKIIPGNEKNIYTIYNKLHQKKIKIINEKNTLIHVSGHPSCAEVRNMYKIIKPQLVIPVHGENKHIKEHCKIAKDIGIQQVINIQNGDVINLSDNKSSKIGKVKNGYYIIDGNLITRKNNRIILERNRIQNNGIIILNIFINIRQKIKNIDIVSPGILNKKYDKKIIRQIKKNIKYIYSKKLPFNNTQKEYYIKYIIKKKIDSLMYKNPLIMINIYNI